MTDNKSENADGDSRQIERIVSLQKPDEAKEILKQAIKDASLPVKICKITDLHPTTLLEIQNHIHQIQNILIAEYVRYTDLKDEIGLR